MPFIDRLKREIPRRRTGVRVDQFYELTKKLIPEIEEARGYGYSWTQICRAIEAECLAQGNWNSEWRSYDIEKNYRRIKKDAWGKRGEA
jgi:hypothetical protein